MAHIHPVHDTDVHFKIDPTTRAITTKDTLKAIIQGDHNSERFSFDLPKIIEGHDMTLCDSVKIHYINTDSTTRETYKGVYEVNDMQELDNATLVLTWLVSRNSTQAAGPLDFLLEFSCIGENGAVDYSWHTGIFSSVPISNGMDNGSTVFETYADILEQWKISVEREITENLKDSVTHEWEGTVLKVSSGSGTSSADLKGDKGDKGDTGDVSMLYAGNNFGNALKETVAGNPICVSDVSPLEHELQIKAEQSAKVYRYGKNLINFEKYLGENYTKTLNGLTINIRDGIAVITGTHTNDGWTNILNCEVQSAGGEILLPPGTYTAPTNLTIQLSAPDGSTGGNYYKTFTINETMAVKKVYIAYYGKGLTVNASIVLMLVAGNEVATEYERGVEPQTAEVVDGTVTGLTSVYPNMTLIADAGTIECTYNRDANKVLTLLTSPNGTKYKLAVSDDGTLTTTKA